MAGLKAQSSSSCSQPSHVAILCLQYEIWKAKVFINDERLFLLQGTCSSTVMQFPSLLTPEEDFCIHCEYWVSEWWLSIPVSGWGWALGWGAEISKQAILSLMLTVYCRRQLLTQQFHKSVDNYRVWSNGRKLQNSVRENKEKTNLDSLTEEVTQRYNVYSRSVEKRLKRLNLSPRY